MRAADVGDDPIVVFQLQVSYRLATNRMRDRLASNMHHLARVQDIERIERALDARH
jgi:hypothetical protein